MRQFTILFFLISALTIFVSCLYGMFPSRPLFARDGVREELNGEIRKVIVTQNRGKYAFGLFPPKLSNGGLTYLINFDIAIKGLKCKSFEEAELIHKDIYRDLLYQINSIRCIRPFLAEFPLTPNAVCLNLFFFDKNRQKPQPPYFSAIICQDGLVKFDHEAALEDFNANDRTCGPGYKIVKQVPITEADWLQDFFLYSVPRTKASSKVIIPTYTRSPPNLFQIGVALFEFEKRFSEKNDLFVVATGTVGETRKDDRAFDFALRGDTGKTLDQARKLAASCSIELLEFVRKNQICLDYLKDRSTWKCTKDRTSFPEPRHLAFRISFWDENVDRQPAPYIAEIRLIDEKFKYFIADAGQRLVLVYEETFDEAQAFLKSLISE